MLKSERLMKLEEVGIFWQSSSGKWYNGMEGGVELTPYLLEAGMFEQ